MDQIKTALTWIVDNRELIIAAAVVIGTAVWRAYRNGVAAETMAKSIEATGSASTKDAVSMARGESRMVNLAIGTVLTKLSAKGKINLSKP